MIREYRTICDTSGQFLTVRNVQGISCGTIGEVLLSNGDTRVCQVVEVDADHAHLALFDSPLGISLADSKVRFWHYGLELPLSEDLLGRTFDSLGNPTDGGAAILPERYADVMGHPINPLTRTPGTAEVRTGITALDEEEPLRLGERCTIAVPFGRSPAALASQIAQQAKIVGQDTELTLVIAAIGLPFEETEHLLGDLRRTGLTPRTTLFLSPPEDTPLRRLTPPYLAMTAAEYLAFEKDRQVLLLFLDLAQYEEAAIEALETASIAPWTSCSPAYAPHHPYTDLAALQERIGCRQGKTGSITLLSILTEDM